MADNLTLNAGSGGVVAAADDVASVFYPRVKISYGPDGTAQEGWTLARLVSAASINATSLKASAGLLTFVYAVNLNAAVRYLKFYNKASSPTVGTDTPVLTLPIPASTTGAGFTFAVPGGLAFGTGIAYATTTGIADSDTAAVAANEIIVSFGYA